MTEDPRRMAELEGAVDELKRMVRGDVLGMPPFAALDTGNLYMVTAQGEHVVCILPPARVMRPEFALRLAAWLVVGAELAGYEAALPVTIATVIAIRDT